MSTARAKKKRDESRPCRDGWFGLGLMARKIEKRKGRVEDDKTCDGYQSCLVRRSGKYRERVEKEKKNCAERDGFRARRRRREE